MVSIPENIVTVPDPTSARLLEKQWRARVYFMACPYRRLLNERWKVYYNALARKRDLLVSVEGLDGQPHQE
jgi:hypothetical protein